MNPLNPQPPFAWPEPFVIEEKCGYTQQPPFSELALTSHSFFGLTSAITSRGVEVLESWLERNQALKARLIVAIYPACATRQADLSRLLDLTQRVPERLSVHVYPFERVTDRGTNAFCFLASDSHTVRFVTGPSEDFGLAPWRDGHVNFVFRADPALVEAFRQCFDWQWAKSREISAKGVTLLPDLVLPEGTKEGARTWMGYMNYFVDLDSLPTVVELDPGTGDVTIKSEDGKVITSPTEELGFAKLDRLAHRMARLYDKGALVSIDKLSRIPPLDAPLDPRLFGDNSELHKGNVTRRVSMRVSIIDERTLKEIEKRRQGLRTLLTKFTFGLADNIRWMPDTARSLFESELERIKEEGQKLISDLLKGDVKKFIETKRQALIGDINAMHAELGRQGEVTKDVIDRVVESMENRLNKVHSSNFVPKLSYSRVSFASLDNALASPWGQAFSLLADIAGFPRKALTDRFFFSGLKVGEDDLIQAMNVADDALIYDLETRGIKDRCKADIELLSRIENASLNSKDRCELVWRMIDGDSRQEIVATIAQKEAEELEKE